MTSLKNIFTAVVLSSLLFSCSGEGEQSRIELFQPDSMRQVLQFDRSNLVVKISVNSGADQTFNVNGSLSTSVVSVTGIRPNEQNEIIIVWIEVVDGRNIEISQQRQTFFADGNTTINAVHDFSLYDYDNDSVSNFQERIDETCIWSNSEQCDSDNEIPPDTSENLLVNGDFSDGRTGWFVLADDPYSQDGELCVTSLVDAFRQFDSYVLNSAVIPLEIGRNYVFSFDIKADTPTFIDAAINNSQTLLPLFDQEVPVSTSYERRQVQYSPARSWPATVFILNVGENPSVRFCIDNVSVSVTD